MLERLDPIYSWAKDNKHQPMYNKVFGSLVSGGGDGFQHIHGVLYSAASNFGFTIPPQCNIESKAQGIDEITQDDDTVDQVKNCTINMTTWARILKDGNPTKDARHGSVDIKEILATKYVHPDVNKFLKKYEKQAKGRSRMGYHSMMAYPYRVEGWSNKYKKSINCSNPKGFSQKAHCAGKKK
jgi:hypothetical protein